MQQHLYGRTLKPSLGISFTERWASFLEDSPVNHSVVQENEKETKIPDTSSPSFWTALEGVDRPLFFWKMLQASFPQGLQETNGETHQEHQFCSMSSASWNEWVIGQRQAYLVRQKLGHLTRENGSSSWPTASTRDHKGGYEGGRIRDGKLSMDTLDVAVQAYTEGGLADQGNLNTSGNHQELWRTPSSSDEEGGIMEMREGCAGKYKLRDHVHAKWSTPQARDWQTPEDWDAWSKRAEFQKQKGVNLHLPLSSQSIHVEQKWATPQSRDAKGAEGRMIREGNVSDLPSQTEVENNGTWNRNNGKLNPRWVETLMGLPVGWVMPSCQNPITPQGESQEPTMRAIGNWMTPEAQNSIGYHMSNGKKVLKLGSQVIQTYTSPVTTAQTSCDCSETEFFQQQQS
jgi:hypothetical protein